jgi:hypothetical protein
MGILNLIMKSYLQAIMLQDERDWWTLVPSYRTFFLHESGERINNINILINVVGRPDARAQGELFLPLDKRE